MSETKHAIQPGFVRTGFGVFAIFAALAWALAWLWLDYMFVAATPIMVVAIYALLSGDERSR